MKMTEEDINSYIGKKDGRLTIIAFNEAIKNKPRLSTGKGNKKAKKIVVISNGYKYYFDCMCDCGNFVPHRRLDTFNFHRAPGDPTVVSCGCYQREKSRELMNKFHETNPDKNHFFYVRSDRRRERTREEMESYIGKRDGMLEVIAYEGAERISDKGYRYFMTCKCDCGKTVHHVRFDSLKFNREPDDNFIRSCGCYRRSKSARVHFTITK